MDAPARSGRRRFLPWWLSTALWLVVAALGVWLISRPLSSLTVLVLLIGLGMLLVGIAELVGDRDDDDDARSRSPFSWAIGIGWIVVGIVVLVSRGFATSTLGLIVAIALIVTGVLRIAGAVTRHGQGWITAIVLGAASVVFGAIALAWPDLTLIVVAIAFGGWLALLGLSRAWGAVADRFWRKDDEREPQGRKRTTWIKTVGALVLLALAVGAGALSLRLNQGEPQVDAFYAAPASAPAEPGVLIRAETFPTGDNGIPDTAEAWRILYSTTRDEGEPAVASALVVAAADRPDGPRPMVAWAHGTTGWEETCAPTVLANPLEAGAMPALDDVLDRGWVLVATDYVGLGTAGPHPYLIGQGEGRSVLDAMKAARQLKSVDLADQAVIWGHSQGGHAALWAGGLWSEYAADQPLDGVVAYAPASDLPGLVSNLDTVPAGQIFASYTVRAYDEFYDDVTTDDVVSPAAQTIVRELSERCLAEPGVAASIIESLAIGDDLSIFRGDPAGGAFGERLDENTPRKDIEVPLLIGQGLTDPLVLPEAQAGYAAARCDDGQELEYREYEGADHVGVTTDETAVADLLAFTEARFAGEAWSSGCDAVSRR